MNIWGLLIGALIGLVVVAAVGLWQRRQHRKHLNAYLRITNNEIRYEEMKKRMKTTAHDHAGQCTPLDCPDQRLRRETTPIWEEVNSEEVSATGTSPDTGNNPGGGVHDAGADPD